MTNVIKTSLQMWTTKPRHMMGLFHNYFKLNRMKKLILLLCCTVASTSAYAERWHYLGGDILAGYDSIEKENNVAGSWLLSMVEPSDKTKSHELWWIEADCSKKKIRYVEVLTYNGTKIVDHTKLSKEWERIPPNSIIEKYREFVCTKKCDVDSLYDEKVTSLPEMVRLWRYRMK